MAHLDRMETRWVQRIEALMPREGTMWLWLLTAECCHPETEVDADKLARIAAGRASEADRKVTFVRYGLEHGQPRFELWRRYGCKVTFFAEPDETSVDQDRKARHWALTASDGDLVRMAQFFPHIEDTSYEADQSKAARDLLDQRLRAIRTGPGVLTSSALRQIHDEAWLLGGQKGTTSSKAEKQRFITGTHHIIASLIREHVFVTCDDETPREYDDGLHTMKGPA